MQLYAVNLPRRKDRLTNIHEQFYGRSEFSMQVIKAVEHSIGAIGLWKSITQIINTVNQRKFDMVIVCEDDHIFTADYSKERLLAAIAQAKKLDADILLGGIHWLTNCVPVTEQLYWVEKFTGLQFAVIFSKFYESILDVEFYSDDAADYKISALSDKIYFTFPFISTQKDFGYSDVTPKNNEPNRVEMLFKDSAMRVEAVNQVVDFYLGKANYIQEETGTNDDFSEILIRTYVLSPSTEIERKNHIISQFEEREEFEFQFIEPCVHENSEIAYWLGLRNIVQQAIANDDDIIIVCDNDHQFTEFYSRDRFIRQIVDLHGLGLEVLCGGLDDFDMAVPVAKDKVWIGAFKSASFLVLYKSVFEKILQTGFDEQSTKESLFRGLTSNKMVLFPFISVRKSFVNTPSQNVCSLIELTTERLTKIHEVAELASLI